MPAKDSKTTFTLFYISLLSFFTPLIILSFFNHPAADDYVLGYQMKNEGFSGFQKNTYLHWGGRFTSTLWGALFALNDFLYNHYYFHSVALIVLTFISICYLFVTINQYFLNRFYSREQTGTAAAVYIVVLCCCYAELSTAFFWFSSAITYQLPVALFHAGLGFCIRACQARSGSAQKSYTLATVFCIVLITGANEMIALCLGVVIFLSSVLVHKLYPLQRKAMALYTLFYLVSFAVLLLSPGARERSAEIPHASAVNTAAFAIGRTAYTLFCIGKEPLFWLCGMWIFLQSQTVLRSLRAVPAPFLKWTFNYSRWLIVAVPLLLILIYTPVMFVSNGSLPDRATNTCIFFAVFLFFICFAALGFADNKPYVLPAGFRQFLLAAIMITIMVNATSFSFPQNLMAGFFYDKVITERENTLLSAKSAPQKTVVLKNYDSSLQEQTSRYFRKRLRNKMEMWIKQKPDLIYVFDDLATDYSRDFLKKFYGVDSLILK